MGLGQFIISAIFIVIGSLFSWLAATSPKKNSTGKTNSLWNWSVALAVIFMFIGGIGFFGCIGEALGLDKKK